MNKAKTPSLFSRFVKHCKTVLIGLIILCGIFVAVISLILPNDELYKQTIVDFLAKQWHKTVIIERISGKWQGFGPRFIIHNLIIKDKDEIAIQQATLRINIFQYLMPKGSTGISLGIDDIAVDLERKASGKIVLMEPQKKKESTSDKLEKILETGSLTIKNLTINLNDSINNKQNRIKTKITVQQNEQKRAFALEVNAQNLAKQFVVKAVANKSNNFMKQANWYVNTEDFSLQELARLTKKYFLPKAQINAQIWFKTDKGNIAYLTGKAQLKADKNHPKDSITGSAVLVYSGTKDDWQATLILENMKTKTISQDKIIVNIRRQQSHIYLDADVLDVSLLKAITQVLNIASDEFVHYDLQGRLSELSFDYDLKLRRIVGASSHFEALELHSKLASVHNLSGVISLEDEQIRLLVDAQDGGAEIPSIMRGKIKWNNLIFTAQTSMQDADLDVRLHSFWCDCQDFEIDGAARINYDEQLFMDLDFTVYHAQVNQLYKYWPANVWKPKVLNFLDQALVSGEVAKGKILYHGLVDDFPFADKKGIFITKSYLQDAEVNYQNEWPPVKKFQAIVDTKNLSLLVHSAQGRVMAASIDKVTAVIKDFKKAFLKIDTLAHGYDNFLVDFLKNSPMGSDLEVLQQDIKLKGKQKVKVHLDFPLQNQHIEVKPVGFITFLQTDFQMAQFQLQKLTGAMDFSGFSLLLNNLQGYFLNQKVKINGEIITLPNKKPVIDVLLSGNYTVSNFENILGTTLPATGSTPWLFAVSNKNSEATNFTASSNLVGIQLDMPEPLFKEKQQAEPFSISCQLPCLNTGWNVKYSDKITSKFSIDAQSNAFKLYSIVFGREKIPADFGGEIEVLDLDKWLALLDETDSPESSQNDLPFAAMSLQVNQLIFMSRKLHHVAISIAKNKQGLVFKLKGDDVKGQVKIANDVKRKGIVVQLEKLHWQALNSETQAQELQKLAKISENYPALHIYIADFIYDGIPLGEAQIEVRPVAQGIRVEKFQTNSALLKLNINGMWQRNKGQRGLSQFNIIMTSPDIAKFLLNLDLHAPISQANTIIDLQASWNGLPSEFEIKNVSGNMHVNIGKGEVVDAKPGMGRILGLFSLTNLPRRLILDFGDVFAKGLRFASMQGDFVLEKGAAFTESFVIDSSSAKIIISGTTDLSQQSYNQMVVVTPRVGRVLPTIGAIAGGAVGAAAGFLVQGMFHKGLKNVGQIIYQVTGTWDEPNIKLITTNNKQ